MDHLTVQRAGDPRLQRLLGGDPVEVRTQEIALWADSVASVTVGGEAIQLEPLRDPVFTSSNPAPELRRHHNLREYVDVVGREPIVYDCTRRLRNRVLQYPMEIQAAGSSPAQELLASFGDSLIRGIRRMDTVVEQLLPAAWWGWRPMQVLWTDRIWSAPSGSRVRTWMPEYLVDKPPHAFAWERAARSERRLIFRADLYRFPSGGATPVGQVAAYDADEQRIGWLTPSWGTLDDPHGLGVFSALWKLVQVLMAVQRAYYAGIDREFGQLVLELPVGALERDEDALDDLLEKAKKLREVMTAANAMALAPGLATRTQDSRTFIDAGNALLEAIERRVRTLVSGTTLTSEQSADGTGSYAMAKVHWQGELSYAAALVSATADEALTDLVHNYIRVNLDAEPDPADLPRVRSLIHQAANAEALRTLFDMGASLDAQRTETLLGLNGVVVGEAPLKQQAPPAIPPGFGFGSPPADDETTEVAEDLADEEDTRAGARRLALRALEVPAAIGEGRDLQDRYRASGAKAAAATLDSPYRQYAAQVLRAYRAAAGPGLQVVPENVALPAAPDELLAGLHEGRTRLYAAGLSYGLAMLRREWSAARAAGAVSGEPEQVLWRTVGQEPPAELRAAAPKLRAALWEQGVPQPDLLSAIRALLGTPTLAPAELLERMTADLLRIFTTAHRASLDSGESGAALLRSLQDAVEDRIESGRAAQELAEGALEAEGFERALADYRRQRETRAVYPYVMYVIRNINTRPNHEALEGFAVRADSPVVPYIQPPNGYNCFCRVIEVSASQAARLGWRGEFPRGTEALARFRSLGGWDDGFPKESYVVGL